MHPCTQYSTNKRGFTLSELLISLAVLGLISALTLPSVFNTVNSQQRINKLKEAYQALTVAVFNYLQTETPAYSAWMPGIAKSLNFTRNCMSNGVVSCGLYSSSSQIGSPTVAWNDNPAGGQLASGVVIAFDWQGGGADGQINQIRFWLDENGATGPNKVGQDVLVVRYFVVEQVHGFPPRKYPAGGAIFATGVGGQTDVDNYALARQLGIL